MKTFRLVLSIGTTTYVEADTCVEEEKLLKFYRGTDLTSEFARSSVLNVSETDASAQGTLFSKWLHGGKENAPSPEG